MRLLILNLLMAIIWVAVTGSASLHNLLFGFVLSLAVVGLLREQIGGVSYLTRVWRILSLLLLFLSELAKSAWKVTIMVLSPGLDIKPGIFAFPLSVERDFEITLLANLITLTPGTLSVDVSEDRKILYVHALDCSDPDAARRDIAEGFERKIREAFQ
ncbi:MULTISPECIES: Na+/H+ antiporter subunit E [Rhizobium/Agrobacterium group]|uniref:Na+/H+ antiporter subunit E n=1 Tax=Rhizobium/Agrobacterium group TaxID=227290 RepID=UPI000B40103F|nr:MULTISPECIES: Na+/H+ antiporter subunit E [Rhizobium/Agrobacterium group]MCF1472918.1 Na+/H+ antiporter subunit E [Allorhizobium ampelinum]MCF1482168.1 Na+/H+ antiporter subunit E [Allorhizobium ampelinum]MVA54095.1 Na+/H+ antiporter subunit E [Agrobacterium vitis]MVA73960.1 Na+/H+ antiporter subunit E [Agrobacterium vitis]NSZ16063.1 Na+/H+ antiporter subunit E [Agrobacterium vitis]